MLLVCVLTAVLTAIYMKRAYLLTFEGNPRWPGAMDTKPKESPWTMTAPLVVLAALSVVGGFVGLPAVLGSSKIHHFLVHDGHGPVSELRHELHVPASIEWGLLFLGLAIAAGGVLFAWFVIRWGTRGPGADTLGRRVWGPAHGRVSREAALAGSSHRWVVNPVVNGARRVLATFDQNVVDGAVNGVAKMVQGLALRMRGVQTGVVQHYALAFVLGVALVLALMLFA